GGSARLVSPADGALRSVGYSKDRSPRRSGRPRLVLASFAEPQRPVGGGGGGGTGNPGGGGGTRGNPGGTPGGTRGNPGGITRGPVNSGFYANNPYTQPRTILPPLPDTGSTNQQILAALAEGTGGFTIFNTNGLLEGLQHIAQEQNEFYLLG